LKARARRRVGGSNPSASADLTSAGAHVATSTSRRARSPPPRDRYPERIPARTQSANVIEGPAPCSSVWIQPARRSVEGIPGCAVEGDRGIGCVSVHEVDDAFEQVELVLGLADATADDNHLPRPAVECLGSRLPRCRHSRRARTCSFPPRPRHCGNSPCRRQSRRPQERGPRARAPGTGRARSPRPVARERWCPPGRR
jgi:hypothetical protein